MNTQPRVARERAAISVTVQALSSVAVVWWLAIQFAGCAESQSTTCPPGFELNADGSECVAIQCEGGVVRDGECVCPDGEEVVDATCTETACIDVNCNDGNECTDDSCAGGDCLNANVADGTACDGDARTCTNGSCEPVSPLCQGVDCDDQNPCTVDGVCDAETGMCPDKTFEPTDTACDGDAVCDGEGNCIGSIVRAPDARFNVRDGSQITPSGSPGIFDESGDQAMVEFPLDFEAVGSAVINVEICDCISGPGDPSAISFRVATYEADGAPGVGDYNSGTDLEVLSLGSGERKFFVIDVTDRVAELRANGASHIGLRFYESSWSQLALQSGAELVARP